MFSGIVESLGEVVKIEKEGSNYNFHIKSDFAEELYIDQSIAHNGTCLTIVKLYDDIHVVTAIHETLQKSNLGDLMVGSRINLERSLLPSTRLDGHFVQGHVDSTVQCTEVIEADGSWYYTFQHPIENAHLIVDKGSVCINGVSLTIVDPTKETFKVAIIPFTYKHTTFQDLKAGGRVNIEYDILGKYLARFMEVRQ